MRRLWLALVLAGCGSEASAPVIAPEPAAPEAARTEAVAPEVAPPSAEAPGTSVALSTTGLIGALVDLHVRPTDAMRALVRGADVAEPGVVAGASLRGEGGTVVYLLVSTSESLERWAIARRDGTYAALRAELDRRIAECEDAIDPSCFECPDCSGDLDDEASPQDRMLELVRLSVPEGGAPVLDGRVALPASGEAHFREVRELDGDGRAEVGISVTESRDTGQSGSGSTLFVWLDGDTLSEQLSVEHAGWAFGCSGEVTERSGFSMHDRNGDGSPDVGVRHGIWSGGCDEADGWPTGLDGVRLDDPSRVRDIALEGGDRFRTLEGREITEDDPRYEEAEIIGCVYYDERSRHLYDPALDRWVVAANER